MAPVPRHHPDLPGDRPLDPERPAPDPARPETPPGLRRQLAATKEAILGLLRAHIDLAKAEAGEIKGEVAWIAAFVGIAIACALLLGILVPVGGILFAGDWLFGSIGWGLLHGTLTLVAAALTAIVVGLKVKGVGTDVAAAAVIGIVLSILFGASLPHAGWELLGTATGAFLPQWQALAVAVIAVGALGLLLGLVGGARSGGISGGVIGLILGGLAGAALGAFTAISFDVQAGAAVGVTIGLMAWIVLLGARTARQGIDTEALKARLWPQTTIDTTMETIEWAKAKNPLGPRS